MKKLQMSRNNNKAAKNSLNPTSHIPHPTSQNSPLTSHGITLMSLIIYITIMFVILALIIRFTTTFTKNISDVADTTFETEFEKFNIYMLQETKKTGNGVEEISEEQNSIAFTDGNIISFIRAEESETGEIYFNNIKLCEGIENCIFTSSDDETTNKTTITVTITINGTTKPTQYVITNKINISQSTSTETNYIIKKTRLPTEYQEVEYIESTGTQYIDTEFKPNSNTKIEIEYIPTTSYTGFMCIYGTQDSSSINRFYALVSGTPYYLQVNYSNNSSPSVWGFNKDGTSTTGGNGTFTGVLQKVRLIIENKGVRIESQECTNSYIMTGYSTWGKNVNCNYNLVLFARNTSGTVGNNFSGKIYGAKIWSNNVLIRNFIPCYRGYDWVIGLYDLVTNEFYTNSGSGSFIAGPNVD